MEVWTLCGAGGMELEAITYGGIVRRIVTLDAYGGQSDVVLGFSTPEPYLAGHPYFGAIVGRVAGRLPTGRSMASGRGAAWLPGRTTTLSQTIHPIICMAAK